eukprot:6200847-Pleurochrysis_carterae.AAC.2
MAAAVVRGAAHGWKPMSSMRSASSSTRKAAWQTPKHTRDAPCACVCERARVRLGVRVGVHLLVRVCPWLRGKGRKGEQSEGVVERGFEQETATRKAAFQNRSLERERPGQGRMRWWL